MTDGSTPAFADQLRRLRRAAGLSQEALAEAAGLSARAVSDLEPGVKRAPRRDTLQALTEALGLPTAERDAPRGRPAAAVLARSPGPPRPSAPGEPPQP